MDDKIADEFRKCLQDRNYLGAASVVRNSDLDEKAQGVLLGELSSAVLEDLSQSRQKGDQERVSFLRSFLAWLAKELPGLSALYREQVRPNAPQWVPEGLRDTWADFNDLLAGRKTLDEGFREKFDEARIRMKQSDAHGSDILKSAEDALKDGLKGVRSFMEGLWSAPAPRTASQESRSDDVVEAKSVRIQNADDPLPKGTKPAEK